MASLTQQKADLNDILFRVVMAHYDSKEETEDRRHLMEGLLLRFLGELTLPKLQSWHRGIVIRKAMKEKE